MNYRVQSSWQLCRCTGELIPARGGAKPPLYSFEPATVCDEPHEPTGAFCVYN